MKAALPEVERCGPTDVVEINPLGDVRWPAFVRDHAAGSIFHTTGWLEALRRTYNYEPAAVATCDSQGNLANAVVYCPVNSWLTGRRLVSLPFSDHCEPLVRDEVSLAKLVGELQQRAEAGKCKYVELRPVSNVAESRLGLPSGPKFYMHCLDLSPGVDRIFRSFHRDCVQRKIRRAERERLKLEEGRSTAMLDRFYNLVLQTRRRQGLPPQPRGWFQNVLDCLGNAAIIRLAYKGDAAIAGTLTLEHGKCIVYKYGASDHHFHNLGGMPYLFWQTIQDAVDRKFERLDMGRSDPDNPGLMSFKDHLGAQKSVLCYRRSPAQQNEQSAWKGRFARFVCKAIPDGLLTATGSLLYRHMA